MVGICQMSERAVAEAESQKTTKQNYVPRQLTLDTNAHTGCISIMLRASNLKNHSGPHVLVPNICSVSETPPEIQASLTGK